MCDCCNYCCWDDHYLSSSDDDEKYSNQYESDSSESDFEEIKETKKPEVVKSMEVFDGDALEKDQQDIIKHKKSQWKKKYWKHQQLNARRKK